MAVWGTCAPLLDAEKVSRTGRLRIGRHYVLAPMPIVAPSSYLGRARQEFAQCYLSQSDRMVRPPVLTGTIVGSIALLGMVDAQGHEVNPRNNGIDRDAIGPLPSLQSKMTWKANSCLS